MSLLALAIPTLSACGSSTNPAAQAAAHEAKLARQERTELVELVSCAHRHGIPLPPPTPDGKILTRGVNLRSPARKAALSNCYRAVVSKATRLQEAERLREGKSAKPAGEQPRNPAGTAAVFAKEHEQLVEVVACAHRHGIPLPEPDTHNHINTSGVNLKGRHRETALSNCFHKVVARATREQEELAHEQEGGPRRLGEEPPAP